MSAIRWPENRPVARRRDLLPEARARSASANSATSGATTHPNESKVSHRGAVGHGVAFEVHYVGAAREREERVRRAEDPPPTTTVRWPARFCSSSSQHDVQPRTATLRSRDHFVSVADTASSTYSARRSRKKSRKIAADSSARTS